MRKKIQKINFSKNINFIFLTMFATILIIVGFLAFSILNLKYATDELLNQSNFTSALLDEIANVKNVDTNDFNSQIKQLDFKNKVQLHKQKITKIYYKNICILFLLLFCAVVSSAIIMLTIIKQSKKINYNLEKTVLLKTKELKLLNESLESRLKKEVEISRQKDQTIFKQSRSAEIGEMLQNVAHQWRQPLGAITMIIQSFETKLEKNKLTPEFIHSQVNEALILANGMSNTLDDFRNFYSPSKTKSEFKISKVIDDAVKFTRFLIEKEDIKLILDIKYNPLVKAYKNELMHVIINIIMNAKDVLCKIKDEKIIQISTIQNYPFVTIVISDNGGGIDENIIEKIFDPYFTTKHQSVGTGIGLYMSKQIIEKHIQGEIKVKNDILLHNNKTYKCAQFSIDIPLSEKL